MKTSTCFLAIVAAAISCAPAGQLGIRQAPEPPRCQTHECISCLDACEDNWTQCIRSEVSKSGLDDDRIFLPRHRDALAKVGNYCNDLLADCYATCK